MIDQERTQATIEQNVNAAADQASEVAGAAVSLGRQVTALWVGVSRTAIDAAAKTLAATAETIGSLAASMGALSKRIETTTKKV